MDGLETPLREAANSGVVGLGRAHSPPFTPPMMATGGMPLDDHRRQRVGYPTPRGAYTVLSTDRADTPP